MGVVAHHNNARSYYYKQRRAPRCFSALTFFGRSFGVDFVVYCRCRWRGLFRDFVRGDDGCGVKWKWCGDSGFRYVAVVVVVIDGHLWGSDGDGGGSLEVVMVVIVVRWYRERWSGVMDGTGWRQCCRRRWVADSDVGRYPGVSSAQRCFMQQRVTLLRRRAAGAASGR
ncbi:Hypothetical predicted protein [Olea europaea subsp. europaea]|uniref:Uncharacterized protein n=1 Tax=Olea europaea subsp. europaea TaxID=158383 RepID=A0A8S0UZS0_OLEEU|nr:Hypothetical predicted protein [Olea europaea subsp. europaea]